MNDDGKRDQNDKYGYVYEPFNNYALFYSLGQSITKKNKDDIPELSIYSPASVDVFEIIRGISDDKVNYYINWSTGCTSIIKDNRALMTSTTLYTIRANYKTWEQDFGILPMPKLTEDQPYVDVVSTATSGSLYSIPVSNNNLELTGYALESFCRQSKNTLRVAYYDLAITHRTMRDVESAEMMDIILANRYTTINDFLNNN
ncbi:hypothetical protein SDC9_137276 [bioreactor metagenome]|uniref:Uncharacterized protein n=1 Tax=bioreactor metagenome TaxID=1076179 RepID=A0A645DLI6_9ZZZZ